MGISTIVIKSVPSPGSPIHTPFSSTSSVSGSNSSVEKFSAGSCSDSSCSGSGAIALLAAIFSRNCSIAFGITSSSSLAPTANSAASGTIKLSASVFAAASAATASSAARAAASSASFSALLLRPRFFGFSSAAGAAGSETGASTGASAKSEGASVFFLVRLALASRFSPSSPFTV